MQYADIVTKYASSMENALLILHELQNKNPQNYLAEKDLSWAFKKVKKVFKQLALETNEQMMI